MSRLRGQRGQVVLWVGLLLPFFLGIVGLVGDGGELFVQHRLLQQEADGAARRGAEQLDLPAYRAGEPAALDPAAAERAAQDYLAVENPGVTGTVAADRRQVTVHLREDVPLVFLRVIGIDTAPVGATARAELRQSSTAPSGS